MMDQGLLGSPLSLSFAAWAIMVDEDREGGRGYFPYRLRSVVSIVPRLCTRQMNTHLPSRRWLCHGLTFSALPPRAILSRRPRRVQMTSDAAHCFGRRLPLFLKCCTSRLRPASDVCMYRCGGPSRPVSDVRRACCRGPARRAVCPSDWCRVACSVPALVRIVCFLAWGGVKVMLLTVG